MMSDQNTDSGWRQVNLWCDDWEVAEQMAVTHLQPLLTESEDSKFSICWWFVRKGPSWRLRLRPVDGCGETTTAVVDRVTTALMDQGAIRRWAEGIYEPDAHAFGGVEAVAIAHDLFSADSHHLLTHLAQARTDHCCTAGTGNDPTSPPSPLVLPDHLMTRPRPQHTSTDHTPNWPAPGDQRGVVVPCRVMGRAPC